MMRNPFDISKDRGDFLTGVSFAIREKEIIKEEIKDYIDNMKNQHYSPEEIVDVLNDVLSCSDYDLSLFSEDELSNFVNKHLR